ncbi:hypothetical protein MIC448_320015 [Microbacterium sp. C448]|uniref:hypothetical protein n=1 Tax=Microbacterium sp. C448 TaxID=1177594 RepID=UPI0003DE60E4|nr:hypothetical protein [Microbacterium sp. C448]CDK00711.1 hypothetical protein MIC448_320015 [Microbacterium sp. C448]
MTTHKTAAYDNYGSRVRINYLDPATCSIAPLAAAGRALEAALGELRAASKERTDAQSDLERFGNDAREQAQQAGAAGKKLDKGKLRKKRQALAERAEDTELDYVAALANMPRAQTAYLEALAEHAPALADHAREEAKAAVASLATAVGVIRRAGASLADSLAIMGALPAVVAGDEFNPRQMKARKETSDDFVLNGAPEVHLSVARESLGTALGFAKRILDDLKKRDKAARLVAEADDPAADIDGEPDEDDDDDFDEFEDGDES